MTERATYADWVKIVEKLAIETENGELVWHQILITGVCECKTRGRLLQVFSDKGNVIIRLVGDDRRVGWNLPETPHTRRLFDAATQPPPQVTEWAKKFL